MTGISVKISLFRARRKIQVNKAKTKTVDTNKKFKQVENDEGWNFAVIACSFQTLHFGFWP